jgi:prepilin-type processing-associated H-X9-DG protein
LVAQVKDRAAFAVTLERLINAANRELAGMGGMFLGRGPGPRGGASTRAEFRKLKGEENAYVLAVPPAVLPTPGGLHLTVMLGKRNVVVATSPDVARAVLKAEGGGKPAGLTDLPEGTTVFSRSDPRGTLPELLVNIPSIVQVIGGIATSRNTMSMGMAPPGRFPGGPPPSGAFALRLDPDLIPDPDTLRPYLFPKTSTFAVTEKTMVLTTTEAFPGPDMSMGAGTSGPVLVALLLPAVQSAREAARRAQCTNNLKQIALAYFNYESAMGNFPGNICDKDGKPLLSWRVAILPYLEQNALYEKFHLDEPWDSPHNLELSKILVKTYVCPSRGESLDGTTTYRAFVGNGAMFENGKQTRLADITDGTSNTILVAESSEAVPWTKPDDLTFDPSDPSRLFGLGSNHPGGFNVALGDGSVRFIKSTIAIEALKALITRAGGEVISGGSF